MIRLMPLPTLYLLLALFAPVAPGPAEVVGQVVCSQCWFEADRNEVAYGTASDIIFR